MWARRGCSRSLVDNQKALSADPFRSLSRPHSELVAFFDDCLSRRCRGFSRLVIIVIVFVVVVGSKTSLEDRVKVLLGGVEEVLSVTEVDGLEGLHNWYGPRPEKQAQEFGVKALQKWYGSRPVKFNDEQYLAARLEAARRVTDQQRIVRLFEMNGKSWCDQTTGNFIERVRQRPLQSPTLGVNEGCIWMWWPIRYRGWAAWQYVWDVRLAQGKIDADTAA